MKSLTQYILEEEIKSKDDKEDLTRRGNIKFTIWKEPKVKVNWLEDNEDYQKIEYQYEDDKNQIYIDFLLGFVPEEKTWKIWIGKIGSCSYDDDPYKDLKTNKFADAILKALDFIEEFIDKVNEDPNDYIQYYKKI